MGRSTQLCPLEPNEQCREAAQENDPGEDGAELAGWQTGEKGKPTELSIAA